MRQEKFKMERPNLVQPISVTLLNRQSQCLDALKEITGSKPKKAPLSAWKILPVDLSSPQNLKNKSLDTIRDLFYNDIVILVMYVQNTAS